MEADGINIRDRVNDELATAAQLDDLLGVIEKLCVECESAWGKDSPQAQKMRTQQQTTQVLVDAVRQIEKDDSEVLPDMGE